MTFKSDIPCKGCKESFWITNKTRHLCSSCVFKLNHGGKSREEVYKERRSTSNKKKVKKNKRKVPTKILQIIERDERFYEYIFNNSEHKCEECGCNLPDTFRSYEGKVVARFQYSHILTKGAYQKFRWHKLNWNRLCLDDHEKWERGDRKSMKIYKKNISLVQEIKENPNNLVE
jgi:hypothetical protein